MARTFDPKWFVNGCTLQLGTAIPARPEPATDGEVVTGASTRLDIAWNVGTQPTVTLPWLKYFPGKSTYITTGDSVLTGPMSGCPIVLYSIGGARTVAHVGTWSEGVNTTVKSKFLTHIRAQTGDKKVFNPAGAWSIDETLAFINKVPFPDMYARDKSQIICFIGNGKAYSFPMLYEKGTVNGINPLKGICGPCKELTPITGTALTAYLGGTVTLLITPSSKRLEDLENIINSFGGAQQLAVMLGEHHALSRAQPSGWCPGRAPAALKQRVSQLNQAFAPHGGIDTLEASLTEFQYLQSLV